ATRELLDWYTSLGSLRTKTSDAIPASVVVDVVLGYKKEDKATSTEITQRSIELKDFLRRYFTQKTAEELAPQNEENLKIEIRNAINDQILSSSKIKDVRFMQLDVIAQ
ncbi:MAG: flagellar basal body-associated FliL family protein, partial [Treponemataceae bacterium]|nr:flagellar basal body-associated FliL family protein [Treponemataceae bacterium]